jgi:hypothetical protein
MCIDYDRRNVAIKFETVPADVLQSYQQTNAIIDAALELVEVGIRRDMLNDIILDRGYHYSPISYLFAKNTYYARKRQIVYKIAKTLKLI